MSKSENENNAADGSVEPSDLFAEWFAAVELLANTHNCRDMLGDRESYREMFEDGDHPKDVIIETLYAAREASI